jgi:hypothetical protein
MWRYALFTARAVPALAAWREVLTMTTQNGLRTIVNEDGAAILDTHSGTMTTLNMTGAYIWQALQEGESAESIAANLARDSGETLDTVEHDVAVFLNELREQHLLSC